jgi:hypothetical protein
MNGKYVIEFFVCPHCLKLSHTTNEFTTWASVWGYSCRDICSNCNKELRVIDSILRCADCERRLSCLGEPVSIVLIIAVSLVDRASLDQDEFKKIIKKTKREILRITKTYGRCIHQDFQQVTYADRKNLHH